MRFAAPVFLALLGAHLFASLALNRKQPGLREALRDVAAVFAASPFIVVLMTRVRRRTVGAASLAALQTVLFAGACWFAHAGGYLDRGLVNPLAIGAGLLAGHAIFGLSLMLTHREVRDVASHIVDLRPLWDYVADNPRILSQFATVSIAEEMIYRAAAQPLLIGWLGSAAGGIALSAVLFAVVHDHFFKNSAGQSAEFLAFSVVLGVLFWLTESLILVIAIHAIRNIEIAYIEHLVQQEGAESERAAEAGAAYAKGERSLVFLVGAGGEMPAACLEYAAEDGPVEHGRPVMEGI